jgi:hypothetical protein
MGAVRRKKTNQEGGEQIMNAWRYAEGALLDRVLKPYVRKALIICGERHAENMNDLLPARGFTFQSHYKNRKGHDCIPLPLIQQW